MDLTECGRILEWSIRTLVRKSSVFNFVELRDWMHNEAIITTEYRLK
jgi:hypothetical protein